MSTSLLICRTLPSSGDWKYVRPVNSVRAAVAHQGQDLSVKVEIRYDTIEEFNVDSKAEYTA